MKRIPVCLFFLCILADSCDLTSPGTYHEMYRVYCPDSSKYLLTYRYDQGAWDGGRASTTTVLNRKDSLPTGNGFSIMSLDFDTIGWEGNDTVIVAEKFTDFVANGQSSLRDTVINGVTIKVIQKDPIDSSYTRKIVFEEPSPDKRYDLIVYRYIKPENGYYFLNISIINKGDSLPKFGNFYISRYDFDCFRDIRWNDSTANELSIKVSESCYYAFNQYLARNAPAVKYKVAIDDTTRGNIGR